MYIDSVHILISSFEPSRASSWFRVSLSRYRDTEPVTGSELNDATAVLLANVSVFDCNGV